MGGYTRARQTLDDIEGMDYVEAEEEEVEVEDPTPKEVLKYLELREKLKEQARKKLTNENGSGSNLQDRRRLQLKNFGSFFGPSQPVIADRVIQECKSFLENQHKASRVSSSQKDGKEGNVSGTLKNGTSVYSPLDPVNTKVQKLRDTRDYSFLFSDEATNVPSAASGHPASSNSDGRSDHMPSTSKESAHLGRELQNSCEEKRPGSQTRPGLGSLSQKPLSSIRVDSTRSHWLPEHKKQLQVGSLGSGRGRPALPKEVPLKKALQCTEKKISSHVDRKPSAASEEKKAPIAIAKGAISHGQLTPVVKSQTNGFGHGRRIQDTSKLKVLARETPSLKPQKKASNQVSTVVGRRDDPYKSKPQLNRKPKPGPAAWLSDDDDDEKLRAIAEIRKMFRYNPTRYAGDDEDLSDMEADFRTIQKEELRSSRIAREEDERELKLIQEEEERERRRKLAKKRKMDQR